MGDVINTKPPNVVGFVNGAAYEVSFNEYIYNDCRDGIELEKIVKNHLKPEKYDSSGSWCGISGFFIKDNIKVNTYWNDMMDYFWKVYTDNEAVKKKVYDWACEVYDKYTELRNTIDRS